MSLRNWIVSVSVLPALFAVPAFGQVAPDVGRVLAGQAHAGRFLRRFLCREAGVIAALSPRHLATLFRSVPLVSEFGRANHGWQRTLEQDYDGLTPVDAARRAGAAGLVQWLQDQDASSDSAGQDGVR